MSEIITTEQERNSAISILETLIVKIKAWEFDSHLDRLNYIIAKNLTHWTVYEIIDTTPPVETNFENE